MAMTIGFNDLWVPGYDLPRLPKSSYAERFAFPLVGGTR
jgi:hypothetical protein